MSEDSRVHKDLRDQESERGTLLCCVIIAIITLAVWGRSAGFAFVWDDHLLVLENSSLHSVRNIPEMFTSLAMQSGEIAPSYRPVRTAWYAFLYALGGGVARPWLFHLSNVLWHCATAMMLFVVARLLFARVMGASKNAAQWTALFVATGFAVHPANSESVCWVKCLDDLMAGLFTLASAWMLLKWDGHPGGFVASLIFFAAAIYSYEIAVPFVFVAVFILVGYHRLPLQKAFVFSIPFFALGMAFMAHRHWVMGRTSQYEPLSGAYGQTLIDMLPVTLKYARLAFGVPPFSADYCDLIQHAGHSLFSGAVIGGVLLLLVFGICVFQAWRASLGLVAAGWVVFALFLAPVSNIIPTMQYIAERFLYLPLMGFAIAAGALSFKAARRNLPLLAGAAVICVWAAVSWNRESIWRDEVTLFVQSSLDQPDCKRLRENAVVAIFELPQVADCFPLTPGARKLSVAANLSQAKIPAALAALATGHALFPDEERFTAALGVGNAMLGRISNAVPLLELATRQSTNDAACWVDLGSAYAIEKNWAGAQKAFENALRLSPTNIVALDRCAKVCMESGNYRTAQALLERWTSLQPQNADVSRRLEEAKQKITENANAK
jgi:tetratricopeptide (TPR) repeat protein